MSQPRLPLVNRPRRGTSSLLLFLLATLLLGWACSSDVPPKGDAEPAPTSPAAPTSGHFLTLSDIHFDPYYDPSLANDLLAKEVSEWQGIFESSTITALMDTGEARYKQDTSYPLLQSALAAVAERIRQLPGQKVDYVLITGDFLAHEFDSTFQSIFPGKGFDDYRGFVLKTMTFIRDQLAVAFPTTPVFPTLGNNDAFCGDYGISPGSDFLPEVAGLWQPLVGQPLTDFSQTGSYTVAHPVVRDFEFVVLNDVPFSSDYPRTFAFSPTPDCDAATDGLAAGEQAWLRRKLDQATGKVALAFHIPPGIDQYGTAGTEEDDEAKFLAAMCDAPATCGANQDVAVDLACSQADAFIDTVSAGVSKISYVMVAHTHQDDFRVFRIPDSIAGGDVPVLVHFNPSISIHNSNNPGFQIFTYGTADGTLIDYTTYYLSNVETAGSRGANDPAATWERLYTFSESYIADGGLPAGNYDAAAVTGLIAKLRADQTFAADTYWPFHALRGPESGAGKIDDSDWDVYLCTLDKLTKAEFSACYCATSRR